MKYLVNMIGVLAVVFGLVASATPASAQAKLSAPASAVAAITPQGASATTHCGVVSSRWVVMWKFLEPTAFHATLYVRTAKHGDKKQLICVENTAAPSSAPKGGYYRLGLEATRSGQTAVTKYSKKNAKKFSVKLWVKAQTSTRLVALKKITFGNGSKKTIRSAVVYCSPVW